jgi:hypothetical protein
VFPNYYSFSQELTVKHQGKLTGSLSCACWLAVAGLHEVFGNLVKQTGSYTLGVALAGLAPLVGMLAFIPLWGRTSRPIPSAPEKESWKPTAPNEQIATSVATIEQRVQQEGPSEGSL